MTRKKKLMDDGQNDRKNDGQMDDGQNDRKNDGWMDDGQNDRKNDDGWMMARTTERMMMDG